MGPLAASRMVHGKSSARIFYAMTALKRLQGVAGYRSLLDFCPVVFAAPADLEMTRASIPTLGAFIAFIPKENALPEGRAMSRSLRPVRFLCVEQLIYRPYNSDPSGASFEVLRRKPLLGFQRGSVRRIFSVFFDQ